VIQRSSDRAARAAGKRYRIVNGRGLVQRTLAVAGPLDLTDTDIDPPS
jgi:hypothetical protein